MRMLARFPTLIQTVGNRYVLLLQILRLRLNCFFDSYSSLLFGDTTRVNQDRKRIRFPEQRGEANTVQRKGTRGVIK